MQIGTRSGGSSLSFIRLTLQKGPLLGRGHSPTGHGGSRQVQPPALQVGNRLLWLPVLADQLLGALRGDRSPHREGP